MDKKVFSLEESSGAFSGISWAEVEDMMALYASGDSIANLTGKRELMFFASLVAKRVDGECRSEICGVHRADTQTITGLN